MPKSEKRAAAHKIYASNWFKLKRAKKKATRECFDCTAPVAPGRSRCEQHLEKRRRYTQSVRVESKKAAIRALNNYDSVM